MEADDVISPLPIDKNMRIEKQINKSMNPASPDMVLIIYIYGKGTLSRDGKS